MNGTKGTCLWYPHVNFITLSLQTTNGTHHLKHSVTLILLKTPLTRGTDKIQMMLPQIGTLLYMNTVQQTEKGSQVG